ERWLRYEREGKTLADAGQEAKPLLVHEDELLMGQSPDGEFRDFLFPFEHCVEPVETGGKGLFKWIPFVKDMFTQIIQANTAARENGETAPENRIVSFHKNDLRPGVSNGPRGTDGNMLEEFVEASQYGHPRSRTRQSTPD